MSDETKPTFDELADEIENFREIAAQLKPSSGDVPQIPGIDIAGFSIPFGQVVGGDHLVWIDFNRRYDLTKRADRARRKGREEAAAKLETMKHRAGILLVDVSGHRTTDALIAAMLHQAFLVGVYYELDRNGEITTRLFENINARFYRTTSVNKYFTMIYGEISEEGRFRFISAGHHPPMIFSREYGTFVEISADRLTSFPPVGLLPPTHDPEKPFEEPTLKSKEHYSVNEISLLSCGDVLLLLTDGLSDHGEGAFFPGSVEKLLKENASSSAEEICARLKQAVLDHAPPTDDISAVIIRRSH